MTNKITIIDYGMGNLYSVCNAVAAVGGEPEVTSDKDVIAAAEKIILPGVGAFGDCMANLHKSGLIPVIMDALHSGKPFLGICLGMQVLFEGSEEAPGVQGLGFFKGQVKYLTTVCKIPHMGWNKLALRSFSPLMQNADGEYVYFVHSFHCVPQDKSLITAVCDYGMEVTASVGKDNVQAFQFHPEKSSRVGMNLLRAFKEWQP
ncbi:imidazole glycerol phosphate synthase subunit HisH [uncultured Phascolarctobacterium sp.]|uniref:imidazole glycerol phosphate synthase subunit HisH n=1 Tax=uncultured Phascolarctobacterium sp. TaxID=512296 RepID=UPI0026292CC8|nr:imidazole glycerol phosphate synthase subunit HisH [uncultured Phascolarctobacterium sp.]